MSAQQFLRSQTDSITGKLPDTPEELMYCAVLSNRNTHAKLAYAVIFYVLQYQRRGHFFHYHSLYLLTYSMVQSPSSEANWFVANQEIPRISRNPKVHYRTHKPPPHVAILRQLNPVHIPTSHLLEIHPNIIHPSTPRSPQWSLSLRFPHQDPIHPPLLIHTRHMPNPPHFSRFYHPHNIG